VRLVAQAVAQGVTGKCCGLGDVTHRAAADAKRRKSHGSREQAGVKADCSGDGGAERRRRKQYHPRQQQRGGRSALQRQAHLEPGVLRDSKPSAGEPKQQRARETGQGEDDLRTVSQHAPNVFGELSRSPLDRHPGSLAGGGRGVEQVTPVNLTIAE
jgi:hypothetical protein